MGLRGLGNFAGGAADGWNTSREDIRRQQEADRLKKEREAEEAAGRAYGIGVAPLEVGGATNVDPGDFEVPKQYILGGQSQSAPFTDEQRHVAGLGAAAKAAAAGGSMRLAIDYTSKAQEAQARAQQRRLGTLQEEQGALTLRGAKKNEELNDLVRGASSLSDAEFLAKAAKFATNGVDDGKGFTFRKDGETGKFFLQQHDRDTRQLVGEIPWDGNRENLIGTVVKYSSAAAFDSARKEEKADKKDERTQTREDQKVVDAREHNKRVYDLQVRHYGDLAVRHNQTYALAQKNAQLMEDRFGKNSPEYKKANAEATEAETFGKNMTKIGTLMDEKADPAEIYALAVKASMGTPKDKMVAQEEYNPATGMNTKTAVSPLLQKAKEYTKMYANDKQAELSEKYGPKVQISVVPLGNGKLGFISSKSPKGTVYKTEAEMAKADKLKGLVREDRTEAPATNRTPVGTARTGAAAWLDAPPDREPDEYGRVGIAKAWR